VPAAVVGSGADDILQSELCGSNRVWSWKPAACAAAVRSTTSPAAAFTAAILVSIAVGMCKLADANYVPNMRAAEIKKIKPTSPATIS